jgi:hypothetical protein
VLLKEKTCISAMESKRTTAADLLQKAGFLNKKSG